MLWGPSGCEGADGSRPGSSGIVPGSVSSPTFSPVSATAPTRRRPRRRCASTWSTSGCRRLGHVRLQALTAGHLNGSTAPSSRKDCQFRRADRRTPYSVARSKTRCAGAGWFEAPLLSPTRPRSGARASRLGRRMSSGASRMSSRPSGWRRCSRERLVSIPAANPHER